MHRVYHSAYVHHNVAQYSAFDRILLGTNQKTRAFDYLKVNIYDDGTNYNNYEVINKDILDENAICTERWKGKNK